MQPDTQNLLDRILGDEDTRSQVEAMLYDLAAEVEEEKATHTSRFPHEVVGGNMPRTGEAIHARASAMLEDFYLESMSADYARVSWDDLAAALLSRFDLWKGVTHFTDFGPDLSAPSR